MTPPTIDTMLLLALPASGKSELRRYLDHLDAETLQRDMGIGPTVQLDDYPYVHLMRRVSQELRRIDQDPIFFVDDESPLSDPYDWLTLIQLVNEDYARLEAATDGPNPAATGLLNRIDRARALGGTRPAFAEMEDGVRTTLERALQDDWTEARRQLPTSRPEGSTVIIEFARGGPGGADMPLPHPLGYRASLSALAPEIRDRSVVLYVWVEPSESRRRNRERAHRGPEGAASILHHGVPETVMRLDYGTDDMDWLERQARRPGTIPVDGRDIPFARFDNRVDRTSFLRADPSEWESVEVARLHADLSSTLSGLGARIT